MLLLATKFGVPVCPHAGGVGLCELVVHLAPFDYVAVSGSLDERMIEYVDHLHEHFVEPVRVVSGRYLLPRTPGYGHDPAGARPAPLSRGCRLVGPPTSARSRGAHQLATPGHPATRPPSEPPDDRQLGVDLAGVVMDHLEQFGHAGLPSQVDGETLQLGEHAPVIAGSTAGATFTGVPLRTALPDSSSYRSSSASRLEFTPGCARATAMATPWASDPENVTGWRLGERRSVPRPAGGTLR